MGTSYKDGGSKLVQHKQHFSAALVPTSLILGLVRVDYYTFKNPFRCGFKPYTKACMISSLASSGNTTTVRSSLTLNKSH